MASPLWIKDVGPIWSPATGGPIVVKEGEPCACCEDPPPGVVLAYRICPCCETQEECDAQLPRYVRATSFPGGPGIYRHESGSCFRASGPMLVENETLLNLSGTVRFESCEACEACDCAEPTQLALSLTGWVSRTQMMEVSSGGVRFWAEVTSSNPMTGSYVIPANYGGPEIILRTFANAATATGPFGEWGKCAAQLFLLNSAVERCVSREPAMNLCKWQWRLKAAVGVRFLNPTTTNDRAVVGPDWFRTADFPGYVPFNQVWSIEELVPCNEGAERCFTGADVEVGPDGGCGAWVNWPGCPAVPRLYLNDRAGCINLEAV